MNYGITTPTGSLFFAGFSNDGEVLWTADKAAAWTNGELAAKAQASLLIRQGYCVQRKIIVA